MRDEERLARESIRRTMELYTMSGDDYNENEYVACFTENGVMEFDPFPGKGNLRLEGRPAIWEFASGFFAALKSGEVKLPGEVARHHITTTRIDFVDAETANAKNYCIVTSKNGVEHAGTYTSVFRKVGHDWLIAYRKWCPDY